MPKLPTFTAGLAPSAPSGGRRATAEDMGAADVSAGVRAVQNAGEGIIQAKEDDESRKVLVSQAEIRAKYAKRLDDAVISGEDTDKIKEQLNNDLSVVSEGLVTKKGAETAALHAANTGAIFDQQANQIQVTRAVVAAKVDGAKFINGLATQVSSDPSSLARNEESVDAFVATLSKIPAEKRTQFASEWKQDLNMAAVLSRARVDPEGTKKAVEAGEYNLTVAQREHAINQADATVRAKRVDEQYIRQQKEYEKHERNEKARDDAFKGIMAGTVRAKDVLENPDLTAASREHLTMFIEARGKALVNGERKSDVKVQNDLYMRAIAPEGTPGKLYTTDEVFKAVQAHNEGKPGLNTTDAERLRSILMNNKSADGQAFGSRLHQRLTVIGQGMANDYIVKNTPGLGDGILLRLQADIEKASEKMRRDAEQGKGPPPSALLDPDSKEYFFTRERLKAIQQDVQAAQIALLPKAVDLRVTPEAATTIEVGKTFIEPGGRTKVMTKELKDALARQKPTPANNEPSDFQKWMAATGGRLAPGQTQQQAIDQWKAGK